MFAWKTALGLAVGVIAALPAQAQVFNVKVKYTCYLSATQTEKLGETRGTNEDLITACLNVAAGNPIAADYAVVFDAETNAFSVVRSCDGAVTCTLTSVAGCAEASTSACNMDCTKSKLRCAYAFQNFGTYTVDGSLGCRQREQDNTATDLFKLSAKCSGDITFNGTPCSITVSSKKPFEPTGGCPAPK